MNVSLLRGSMPNSVGIRTPKRYGEKMLILVNKLEIVNHRLEIQRDADFIYVPLISEPSASALKTLKKQVRDFEVLRYVFPERKKREVSYVELLEDHLPTRLQDSLPHAIDFVGDIAIIEIPSNLEAYRAIICEAILKANKNVRTVVAKAGVVSGTYRLREFQVIAGVNKTETIHKEHGSQYYVDIAKAYFSPRLSHEHNRVASLVKEGEVVVDLFAGVGSFPIQIAKKRKNVKVYAIDINPLAIEYLKKNIRLNRVEGKVTPILGDARQIVATKLAGTANRVIMNLPEKANEFIDTACRALKSSGGIIHFYSFINASDSLEDAQLRFIETIKQCGRNVERIPCSRFVRATAPYEWQIVLDAEIS